MKESKVVRQMRRPGQKQRASVHTPTPSSGGAEADNNNNNNKERVKKTAVAASASARPFPALLAAAVPLRHLCPRPELLPLLFAAVPAVRAEPAVGGLLDAREAPAAAPPARVQRARGPPRPPLLVLAVAAPQDVLEVEHAQVVAEVVLPQERVAVPAAPLVVALELGLLVVVAVHDPHVPLQVGLPAGALFAPGVRAAESLLVDVVVVVVCQGSAGRVSGTGLRRQVKGCEDGQPKTYGMGAESALYCSSGSGLPRSMGTIGSPASSARVPTMAKKQMLTASGPWTNV